MVPRTAFPLRLPFRSRGPRAGARAASATRPPRASVSHRGARPKLPRTASFLAFAAAVGLAGLLASAPAAAAPFVDVTYDLGDSTAVSTVSVINVTTEVPPHGTISGTQTIRYAGGSGSYTGAAAGVPTLATGPAELLTFNLDVHATVGYSAFTTGGGYEFVTLNTADLHFEFLSLTSTAADAGGVGQRVAGGTIQPYGASGRFRVTGTAHCYVACAVIERPASTPLRVDPSTFTAPLPTLTGATGYPHTIRGTATGVEFFVFGLGVKGETRIVGREIDRTAVPEPSTLPLLAGGLAGLGLAAAAWRRRVPTEGP